jgi:hypothetical protein
LVTAVTDNTGAGATDFSGQRIRAYPCPEDFMKLNVGGIDRILRIVVGLVLVALAATGTVGLWGWIGVVPLLTGVVGLCPLYSLIGVDTCATKKA